MYLAEEKNGKLFIGGVAAAELAGEFGSPLYVYDGGVIRRNFEALSNSIDYPRKRIHYAMKANNNIRLLQILLKEGCHIDAVSTGDIQIALAAGFPPDKILFTGASMTVDEMDFAVKNGVMLCIGSLYNLETYGKKYPGTAVAVRMNPDFGAGHHDHVVTGGRESKFGIFEKEVPAIRQTLERCGLRLSGVHAHIGSGILESGKFVELMNVLLPIAGKFPGLDFVDFGGGIGVPYRPGVKDFDLARFGAEASKAMSDFSGKYGRELTIGLEPGRFLVAESGVFLVTVTDIKDTPKYTFVGVDSGFNHLIRPMAYGSYHHILNASNMGGAPRDVVVSGYICESGDVFTRGEHGLEKRAIPDPRPGDVLALMTAGAYGFSMSMNYNARPRPAEVLVENGVARLIRRRETIEDLLQTQV